MISAMTRALRTTTAWLRSAARITANRLWHEGDASEALLLAAGIVSGIALIARVGIVA